MGPASAANRFYYPSFYPRRMSGMEKGDRRLRVDNGWWASELG